MVWFRMTLFFNSSKKICLLLKETNISYLEKSFFHIEIHIKYIYMPNYPTTTIDCYKLSNKNSTETQRFLTSR